MNSSSEPRPAESPETLEEYRETSLKLIRTLVSVLEEADPRKARQLLGTVSVRTSKYMTG